MIYSPNLSLNLNKKSGQTVLELRFVTKKTIFSLSSLSRSSSFNISPCNPRNYIMRVKNTINLDQEVITSVCLVNVYWDTLTRTQVTSSSWKTVSEPS